MPTPKLTDEQAMEAAIAYATCGTKSGAAISLGLPRQTFQSRLKVAAERGLVAPGVETMPGYRIDALTTTPNGTYIKQRKEHGEEYTIPDGLRLKGESALVDADNRQVLKWVKSDPDKDAQEAALRDAIKAEFEQYKGYAQLVPPPSETYAELCTYYPIADPHIGAQSHGKETGESNDLKIGTTRVGGTLQRLVGLSPASETAVIINTGDFFHADDQRNVTPASGHQLDVDGRAQKVRWAGVNMLRTTIDFALQKHKRVIVKNLKGNHDPESASWLNISLGMFYWNEERVEIDPEDANNDHFFHLFGVNYTGATHGHTMKPDRMYIMMAEDNPDYWNASLYRWCIFGHIHHETKKQIGSLICESFSQPVPRDSFAHSHGYRSGSAMQSITLHAEGGEQSRVIQRFPPVRPIRAANDNKPEARRVA